MAPSLSPVVARDGSVVVVGEIGVAIVGNRDKTCLESSSRALVASVLKRGGIS